jgi:dTMP kinase
MPKVAARRKRTDSTFQLRDLIRGQESRRGFLVSFEGPDGSGKTTQKKLFKKWLETAGHRVVSTRWNSSALIRPLIKARKGARSLSPREYCLLYAAGFRHQLEVTILPALWAGATVIADGYFFTGLARGAARGVALNWMLRLYEPLFWPDLAFYFRVSPETSRRRAHPEKPPKFYDAGQDVTGIADAYESFLHYVSRVNQEYAALAQIFEMITLDAEQSIYEQHRVIRRQFHQAQRRPWADWNMEALLEWLVCRRRPAEVRLGT